MDFAQSPAPRAGHRVALLPRLLAHLLLVAVVATLAGFSQSVLAADRGGGRRAAAEAEPRKAVIVVGPVGSATVDFRRKGKKIAAAAEAHGMVVEKVFTPCATWSKVMTAANGADLFVYLGHGSGFPRPGEDPDDAIEIEEARNRNGLGLNPTCGSDNTTTRYYGAAMVREAIRFADNAIVLLNHLCYAAGNGEEWQQIPRRAIAVQRVDNFAAGFLAAGARTVFAWRIQAGENLVDALFTEHKSMDDIFRMRFGSNLDGSWLAYYGWVGSSPDLYFDSARTPGARIHLDPDGPDTSNTPVSPGPRANKSGYSRAVTGDLTFTTDEWRGESGDPGDVEPPAVTRFRVGQATNTFPAGDASLPVFTPNRDGLSDTLKIRLSVSEPAYLGFEIADDVGKVVRRFTIWSDGGSSSTTWDGRNEKGKRVADGRYRIRVQPRDRARNEGRARSLSVKVLTSMKSPAVDPELFHPADDDLLAQSAALSVRLIRRATLRLRILDRDGDPVRLGIDDQTFDAGTVTWDWDGRDNDGGLVADGEYTAMFTVSTDAGSYSHRVLVKVGAFQLRGDLTVTSGERVKLTVFAAEPVVGWPVVEVKQPGKAPYTLYLTRYSPTRFTAPWKVRAGKSGRVTITISGTDTSGGEQVSVHRGRVG
jgi:flagellar hook assembly protein FlgD